MEHLIEIAKLGKSIGISGAMRCSIFTDFPNIFKQGNTFFVSPCQSMLKEEIYPLTLKAFSFTKSIISFEEIKCREDAKKITNFLLFSSLEDTKKYCTLKQGEFFWFDIIGCFIYENNFCLGEIKDIQRIANTDYLIIKTHNLLTNTYSKEFLIPYIDHFILEVDIENKKIYTKNAKDLLEAS